jgi:hypothetical protein
LDAYLFFQLGASLTSCFVRITTGLFEDVRTFLDEAKVTIARLHMSSNATSKKLCERLEYFIVNLVKCTTLYHMKNFARTVEKRPGPDQGECSESMEI